ncbi:uncharacterized protein BDV14DRAFT_20642 [Aspergillus stella-maris]|uniref:uncharacterized protein n=1 Tax=Aspergillus stella-maris TaxID=1810926 RepID=UPI003CCDBB81
MQAVRTECSLAGPKQLLLSSYLLARIHLDCARFESELCVGSTSTSRLAWGKNVSGKESLKRPLLSQTSQFSMRACSRYDDIVSSGTGTFALPLFQSSAVTQCPSINCQWVEAFLPSRPQLMQATHSQDATRSSGLPLHCIVRISTKSKEPWGCQRHPIRTTAAQTCWW